MRARTVRDAGRRGSEHALQTTLLGIAVAIILALIAALVGPHFVDWNEHRAYFEAEATKLVGQPVRIGGADRPAHSSHTGGHAWTGRGRPRRAAAGARARAPCRAGARLAHARRRSRFRIAHRGPRRFAWRRRQREARLARDEARLRAGSLPDRKSRNRRRPLELVRRRKRHAGRAARLLVQGRRALAARTGERRGRFHLEWRALQLSRQREPPRRRRRREGEARHRSGRSSARDRGRGRAAAGRQCAALRRHAHAVASRRRRARRRARSGRGAVARQRQGEGRAGAGAVRTARVSVRPGRARDPSDRYGGIALRQEPALRERALGAADRSRSRAGIAGSDRTPAARGAEGLHRAARRRRTVRRFR